MKITCACGNAIVDQTDSLKNKGHMISDSQWFEFWEANDKAIEQVALKPAKQERLIMERRGQRMFRTVWECTSCGRLFINRKGGDIMEYTPASGQYNRALYKLD